MTFREMAKANIESVTEEMYRFFSFLIMPENGCCLCCYDTGGNFFCK